MLGCAALSLPCSRLSRAKEIPTNEQSPAANWFVLLFLAMVLVMLAFNEDTRIGLYVTPVWILVLVVGYFASRSHHPRVVAVVPPPAVLGKPAGVTRLWAHGSAG